MHQITLPLCFLLCTAACSNKEKSSKNVSTIEKRESEATTTEKSPLPFIDLRKEYPKKTINIEDIADVEYIPLETRDDVLVNGIFNTHLSDELIIFNTFSRDVFTFDRKGNYVNGFNHKGNGPGEYLEITSLTVDWDAGEIFIQDHPSMNRIQIYSLAGKFKRTIQPAERLISLKIHNKDKNTLLAYWEASLYPLKDENVLNSHPYVLIDKQTGAITPLTLTITPTDQVAASSRRDGILVKLFAEPINNSGAIVVADFALDTIYTYEKNILQPFAVRNITDLKAEGKEILSSINAKSNRYILFDYVDKGDYVSQIVKEAKEKKRGMGGKIKSKSYLYNIETKETCEPQFYLSTISGEEVNIGGADKFKSRNQAMIQLPRIDKLKTMNENGNLSGKLKEIASTLKEDDNPVLAIATFKE